MLDGLNPSNQQWMCCDRPKQGSVASNLYDFLRFPSRQDCFSGSSQVMQDYIHKWLRWISAFFWFLGWFSRDFGMGGSQHFFWGIIFRFWDEFPKLRASFGGKLGAVFWANCRPMIMENELDTTLHISRQFVIFHLPHASEGTCFEDFWTFGDPHFQPDRFCLGSNPKHQCPRISWDRIPSRSVLGRCYSQCTETLKCFLHLRRLLFFVLKSASGTKTAQEHGLLEMFLHVEDDFPI